MTSSVRAASNINFTGLTLAEEVAGGGQCSTFGFLLDYCCGFVRASSKNCHYNSRYGRSRVLPLQAVDRGGRRARLLDDQRRGSHRGSLGGFAGCLGATARDRRVLRRSADLRLAQIDHVLAQLLLLLCAPEAELSRTLRVPRSHPEGSSSATHRPSVEIQGRACHSHQTPR